MRPGGSVLFSLAGFFTAQYCFAIDKDLQGILREADRLRNLFNWSDAGPLYAEAEKMFAASGDERNALYAKFGRIRSSMEMVNLPQTSDYLDGQLQSALLQKDLRLRLRCLIVKGDIDGEIDSAPATADWQEAIAVAHELEDKEWESRASAELGFQQFLQGDTANAMKAVGSALMTARNTGDVGAEIRYLRLQALSRTLREPLKQISFLEKLWQLYPSIL